MSRRLRCWSCGGALPASYQDYYEGSWPPCLWCGVWQSPEDVWDAMPSAWGERGKKDMTQKKDTTYAPIVAVRANTVSTGVEMTRRLQ